MASPITPHLRKILESIRDNAVVSLYIPPGLNQNIIIPAKISIKGTKVYVAVPNEAIAKSLAEQQKSSNTFKYGGYEDEENIDQTQIITYVTAKYLWQKMLTYFDGDNILPLDFCAVIILSEIYPGTLDYSMITSLYLKASKLPVPRLVLMNSIPIVHPITSFEYKISNVQKMPVLQYPGVGDIYNQISEFIERVLSETKLGNIVIILQGQNEKLICATQLKDNDLQQYGPINLILNQGAIKLDNKDIRTIILVTPEEVPFLDVSPISYVIDSMLEIKPQLLPSEGIKYVTQYISQDKARQHAEISKGACIRLCLESTYNQLNKVMLPTINQEPLQEAIIELLRHNVQPTLKDVESNRLNKTVNLVKKLSLVTIPKLGNFTMWFNLSIRNSAFLWHWIRGGRFYDKLLQDSINSGINFSEIEIDETSEYSSIKPYNLSSTKDAFIKENVNPNSIIDATSNIGGDSINFMKLFPTAKLVSIEIDHKISLILRRNLNKLNQILNTDIDYNTRTINMSALEYFKQPRYADMIYFDPPWGGKDYMSTDKLKLELDNIGIGIIIGEILSMTKLVILKVPTNVDLDTILTDININVDYNIYDIINDSNQKVDYRLIFIRSDIRSIASKAVAPEPDEVEFIPFTNPIYQGIIIACLIDSFDLSQPYFRFPRKKQGAKAAETNKILEGHKKKYYSKYIGYNDLDTYLNMYNDLTLELSENGDSTDVLENWAKNNSINYSAIKSLTESVTITYNILEGFFEGQIIPVIIDVKESVNVARPILLKVYSDMTFIINKKNDSYYSPINKQEYFIDTQETVNKMINNKPPGIIALSTKEFNIPKGVIRLITFGIDTKKSGLGKDIEIGRPKTSTKASSKASSKSISKTIVDTSRTSLNPLLNQNPFDILDELQNLYTVPIILNEITIYDTRNIKEFDKQLTIARKITNSKSDNLNNILNDFYGVLSEKNKWSTKINVKKRDDRFDGLIRYLPKLPEVYLDIGSGDGLDFQLISKKLNPKITISADIEDHRLIKSGEFVIIEPGIPLPIDDASTDVITIFHALHHSKDALFRLKDIWRILKPGGIFVLKDHDVISKNIANIVSFEHLVYSIGEGNATLDDSKRYNEIEPMYYYPAQYIRNYLQDLGYDEILFDAYKNQTQTYMLIVQKK